MVSTRSATAAAASNSVAPSAAGGTAAMATADSGQGVVRTKVLVTGGAGFLGSHLVQQLIDSGRYDVSVFDIRPSTCVAAHSIVGDLRKPDDVLKAVQGQDVVMHCATASPTGENALNMALMKGVNIDGTQHILDACQAAGVTRLVYTSSASVVFEGKRLEYVDETQPYAGKPMDYYTLTKILGEKMVLQANGFKGLATCALRPSGIFGESDPLFVPTLIRNAKAGKTKYIIGDGRNEMDFTYVGNVAQAHIQAAEALSLKSPLAGTAYFITNRQPIRFWTMMGDVCEGLGYARPAKHLPLLLILILAYIFEYIVRPLVRPFKQINSDFTVNRILLATTTRTFNATKAERDFGFQPKVSMSDALQRTVRSFPHLRKDAAGAATAADDKRKAA